MGGDFRKNNDDEDDEFFDADAARSASDENARKRANRIISEMSQEIRDAISDNQRHVEFFSQHTKEWTTDNMVNGIVQDWFFKKGYEFGFCGGDCCGCNCGENCDDDGSCEFDSVHYYVGWDN